MPPILAKPPASDMPSIAELERMQTQTRRRRAGANAGIPRRHAPVIENICVPWRQKLDGLSERLGDGFLVALLGERGTGKTQLAVELVRHHIETSERPWPLYVRTLDIFMGIREAYRPNGPTERQQLDEFTKRTLLIVDDAHERGGSDWENRLLTYLIDVRYGDKLDTVLISNQEPDEFKLSIGLSIYGRLLETGGIWLCDWPSFRRPKSAGGDVESHDATPGSLPGGGGA